MSEFPMWYQQPREEDFWCEQDAKWHPECDCEEQCHGCALIQGMYKYHCHRCKIWFDRSEESCPKCKSNKMVST